jgi:PD-(D/E)XK nuclease superfamily
MKPSLFRIATSELSQDAFICWLLQWAAPAFAGDNPPLHQLGTRLLRELLRCGNIPAPEEIRTVSAKRQHHKIDVFVRVNDSISIIIEDKTNTRDHNKQLQRYRTWVESEYPGQPIAAIYFKTGDQSCYADVQKAGYSCFLRNDFLRVLGQIRELNIKNDIIEDYYENLSGIESEIQGYRNGSKDSWTAANWTGFFMELKTLLKDGNWGYVPNRSGGFMGYWWHWNGNKYLQLEEEQLCFKLMVEEPALQPSAWESWHQQLMAAGQRKNFPLVRPDRRSNGTYMTVARFAEVDFRSFSNGKLDMSATLTLLKRAEDLLDDAVQNP